MKQPKYITEGEAARMTGFTVWAFQAWRYRGNGPKFFKIGHRVRYKRADVIAWMERTPRQNTIEQL